MFTARLGDDLQGPLTYPPSNPSANASGRGRTTSWGRAGRESVRRPPGVGAPGGRISSRGVTSRTVLRGLSWKRVQEAEWGRGPKQNARLPFALEF